MMTARRISTARLGRKTPHVNTSPWLVCKSCGERKYKREFRRKNGGFGNVCRSCRRLQRATSQSDFVRYKSVINKLLQSDYIERKLQKKEVKNMAKVSAKARQYAESLPKTLEAIAWVIGRTSITCGEDAEFADDEALMKINDLLEEFDSGIVGRMRKKKRLPKTLG